MKKRFKLRLPDGETHEIPSFDISGSSLLYQGGGISLTYAQAQEAGMISDETDYVAPEPTAEELKAREEAGAAREEKQAAAEKATEAYDAHYLEAARALSKLGLTAEQIVAVSMDYPMFIKAGKLQEEIDWLTKGL